MPAPKPKLPELVVGYVGPTRPRGPATAVGTWLRTSGHGVVRVERAPGVARDVASRPEPAPAMPTAWGRRQAEAAERDAAVYALLGHGTAQEVADLLGRSRDAVLGASFRHRRRHGLAPRVTPAAVAAETRHAVLRAAAADLPPALVAARADVDVRTVRAAIRRVEPPRPRRVVPAATCAPVPVAHDGPRLSLVDVGPGQCRDLGDDGLCCCAPVRVGTSWCPGHHALYTRMSARAA